MDTSSWTEDDWKYQIYLYRNNSAAEASEKLKNWLVEEYGQDVVDAVSNGVDTGEWTEDDWVYYIWLYQNRIAGEELKAAMAEQYGQETIDAISAENDTSEWTEDDWEYYIWLYRNIEDEDKPEGEEDSGESGKNSDLLDELANSGVKYNPEDIVAITKTADGKLVWLENGTDTAGLNHIITEHADDFLNKGITQEQIPDYIMNALENGKIVGYQGRGTGRPIYEFTYNGEIHKVAITVGNNGFIVGANPK